MRSGTGAALSRGVGLRQEGVRGRTQTEAGQPLAELGELDWTLPPIRQRGLADAVNRLIRADLFTLRSRFGQGFYGHSVGLLPVEFGLTSGSSNVLLQGWSRKFDRWHRPAADPPPTMQAPNL
jgi:hypothetical protein